MLLTNKINICFCFRNPLAARKTNAPSVSKVQKLDDTNLDEFDKRISIAKSEDFYKAHTISMTNAFSQLNR